MTNLVGQTLGKYHLVALLGQGGMAEVYKASQAVTGANVIKSSGGVNGDNR